MVAHRGDGERILAQCASCGSVYAARKWPDGNVQPIGSIECSCGTAEFLVVTDGEDDDPSRPTGAE
ncbi:hypothetical protein ACLI4Y_17545 [Natrialbaceae archaeon A-CW3]